MTLERHLATARRLSANCLCALALAVIPSISIVTPSEHEDPTPVYVTLQGSDAVGNAATGKVWHGLAGAHYVAVSPDGAQLLVSGAGTSDVYLVNTADGKLLKTFDVGPVPQNVAISPNGRLGLAVSEGNGTVAVIDMRKQALITFIHVGKVPHAPLFTADGQRAYVTLQGSDAVAVLDMRALTKIGQFPVPGLAMPHNLDLSANGEVLWIRGFLGKVAAVNVRSHKVLAVIPVGASHAGIDVIPGGRYVVTGGIGGDVVDVIDPGSFAVVKRIKVGKGPHGVRASKDGRWVFAGVVGTDKVAVIDMTTLRAVKQETPHGKVPFWVAVPGND